MKYIDELSDSHAEDLLNDIPREQFPESIQKLLDQQLEFVDSIRDIIQETEKNLAMVVLLWADGKKHLRLMSLWRQRQLSAKFLRFFERNRICWTECKILTFRSHSPLKSAEKRSIAVNLRKNGALPLTCK